MRWIIVLKRLNDQPRFIVVDSTTPIQQMAQEIFNQTWDLVFNQTPDGQFTLILFGKLFKSIKLMFNFWMYTHFAKYLEVPENFGYIFFLIKELLYHFRYWNKHAIINMELIDANTQAICDPYVVSKQLNRSHIRHFSFFSYD